jgi:NAD(P)H-flavin reductase
MLPHPARITWIQPESDDTRTFVLRPEPAAPAFDGAEPGQFVMVSVLGAGEAAFTLSALPDGSGAPGTVVVTVRRAGRVTSALFAQKPGALLGVRGPYGRGFPAPVPGVPALYVAGGCGLSPLKAAIEAHLARAPRTSLAVLYGARSPATRIHRAALAAWAARPDMRLVECVEEATPEWQGRRGALGAFLDEVTTAVGPLRAALCGPPAMLAPVARRLVELGMPADAIHVALERVMKCGVGLCGHCYVNHRYVCTDGPVFSLAELETLPDAFGATPDAASAR